MTGEATPQDVAADFLKMLDGQNPGIAPDGAASVAASTEQTDAAAGDGLAEFQDAPTDTPDVAALKKQLRATMTRRTQEIAEERKRIADERRQYDEDRALIKALKQAKDPVKAAEALLGNQQPQRPNLDAIKGKFDDDTWNALQALVDAKLADDWETKRLPQLTPYGQALNQMLGERVSSQEAAAIAEFGDAATRWMDEARKFSQQTGVPIRKALITVSDGQVAIDKLRAAVLDKRKREVTQSSVPDNAVSKIRLTRDEMREERNKKIKDLAAKYGAKEFMQD